MTVENDATAAAAAARSAGFRNLSMDLILGWPGETRARFLDSLHRLLDLAPDHVSLYVLETDGKSVIGHRASAGTLRLTGMDERQARAAEAVRAAGADWGVPSTIPVGPPR